MSGSAGAALPIMAGIAAGVATGNPAIGMAVAGGLSSVSSGVQQQRAASKQSARLDQQASYEKRNAAEQALAIADERRRASGALAARFAGRGLSGSLTAGSFEREVITVSDRRMRANDLNLGNRLNGLDAEADAVEEAGRAALIQGIGQAAFSAYSAYGDFQGLQDPTAPTAAAPTVGQPRKLFTSKSQTSGLGTLSAIY